MPVLLIKLSGPLQSWGSTSNFADRDTNKEPTKSGVIGLVCAAMGINKDKQEGKPSIAELSALKMSVRHDRPGRIMKDFYTARNIITVDGEDKKNEIGYKDFLADAEFIVALEGNREILEKIHVALGDPKWPMYLGRKSYIPSCPIRITNIQDIKVEEAFKTYPRRNSHYERKNNKIPKRLKVTQESPDGAFRHDNLLSIENRQYSLRCVKIFHIDNPTR
jgi:CRISPR system Cascade subunit CasD